ncbi:MAG: hypothetical protein M3Q10_10220 [Chloroflexota bacterium]|nr:hypothetical protein [Chloroflexota bacterium]
MEGLQALGVWELHYKPIRALPFPFLGLVLVNDICSIAQAEDVLGLEIHDVEGKHLKLGGINSEFLANASSSR